MYGILTTHAYPEQKIDKNLTLFNVPGLNSVVTHKLNTQFCNCTIQCNIPTNKKIKRRLVPEGMVHNSDYLLIR